MTFAVAVRDPVTAYAESVVAGRVPANRLVRLACRRFDDLRHDGRVGGDT